jgi:hypothetical protein
MIVEPTRTIMGTGPKLEHSREPIALLVYGTLAGVSIAVLAGDLIVFRGSLLGSDAPGVYLIEILILFAFGIFVMSVFPRSLQVDREGVEFRYLLSKRYVTWSHLHVSRFQPDSGLGLVLFEEDIPGRATVRVQPPQL